MPTALITGIAGQDGSYLAEQLLARGYRTCGIVRSLDATALERISPIRDRLELQVGDVTDADTVHRVVSQCQPDEIYHLASASSVARSWEQPGEVLRCESRGTLHLLEAIRRAVPGARAVIASSAEVFDFSDPAPRRESSPIGPGSPYGVAKAASLWLARCYRTAYGLRVSCALLFPHESPRRPRHFLSRKISLAVAAIAAGRGGELRLGNLDARRDWGAAEQYTEALWLMAQERHPDDYVIGTGRPHSVRDLCEMAFGVAGLDYRDHVVSDPALFRPSDPPVMVADPARIRDRLGWTATRPLRSVIEQMVATDGGHLRAASG